MFLLGCLGHKVEISSSLLLSLKKASIPWPPGIESQHFKSRSCL